MNAEEGKSAETSDEVDGAIQEASSSDMDRRICISKNNCL